ncbi:MAG: ATP synthase F1 subunit epsilon [Magnetococcales bacterium]|nr:ATP synthase F1 subunit epsilon [Magnetococcales bacterium]
MAVTVQLQLVTPEKKLIDAEVPTVLVPGLDGDFGVLPGHTRLISEVRPGMLIVDTGQEEGEVYAVGGGVAEVSQDIVTVLVDKAVTREDIDLKEAEAEIKETTKALKKMTTIDNADPVQVSTKERLQFAKAKVDAYGFTS